MATDDQPGTVSPASSEDLTATYLDALRPRPQSARDLAVTLGQSTARSNVGVVRHRLELLERRSLVQRTQQPGKPWIWEVCADA
jgi:hypothetical protein